MQRPPLFFINPVSGTKGKNKLIKELQKRKLDYVVTGYAGHIKEFLKQRFDSNRTYIAVGGDGTVNELACALQYKDAPLAVYPMGSGNGFARSNGFNRNLEKLTSVCQKGDIYRIDSLQINDHFCVNVAGIGFDAVVAHYFHQLSGRGLLNYVKAVIVCLSKMKPVNIILRGDFGKIEGQYMMVSIANGPQFGNDAFIAPNAKFDDGAFDITLLKTPPWYTYPELLFRLFNRKLQPTKYLAFIRTSNPVLIESDSHIWHVDGEPLTMPKEVEVSIQDKTVNVLNMRH